MQQCVNQFPSKSKCHRAVHLSYFLSIFFLWLYWCMCVLWLYIYDMLLYSMIESKPNWMSCKIFRIILNSKSCKPQWRVCIYSQSLHTLVKTCTKITKKILTCYDNVIGQDWSWLSKFNRALLKTYGKNLLKQGSDFLFPMIYSYHVVIMES